jgi:hypothetical protein
MLAPKLEVMLAVPTGRPSGEPLMVTVEGPQARPLRDAFLNANEGGARVVLVTHDAPPGQPAVEHAVFLAHVAALRLTEYPDTPETR